MILPRVYIRRQELLTTTSACMENSIVRRSIKAVMAASDRLTIDEYIALYPLKAVADNIICTLLVEIVTYFYNNNICIILLDIIIA